MPIVTTSSIWCADRRSLEPIGVGQMMISAATLSLSRQSPPVHQIALAISSFPCAGVALSAVCIEAVGDGGVMEGY